MKKDFATVSLPLEAVKKLRAIAAATAAPGRRPSVAAAALAIIESASAVPHVSTPAGKGRMNITLPANAVRRLLAMADEVGGTTTTALAALIAEARVPRARRFRKPSAEALAALSPAHRAAYLARMESPQPTYAEIARRPEIHALGLNNEPAVKYAAEQVFKKLHG